MSSTVVRLLRLASTAICLIVLASFLTFAVDETKSAAGRQQELLNAGAQTATADASSPASATTPPRAAHKSTVHKAIDEASSGLTSPFAGLISASSGEWATRAVRLLAALLVYGFGLGYLARALRVRTRLRS